jgi:group I intron endonuclease
MRTGYIYKIINPKGKVYVGQTINLQSRIKNYRNLKCSNQKILYNSILKYGWENHKFEIIETIEIENDKSLLNEKEIFWIKELKSFGDGMNCNAGGNGNVGRKCSEETKKKISQGNLGKKQSDETKKKIAEASKGRSHIVTQDVKDKISRSKQGQQVSDETKQKISKFNKGKILSEEHKNKIKESSLGKKMSEEAKKNISNGKKGKPWTEARRLAQNKNNNEVL